MLIICRSRDSVIYFFIIFVQTLLLPLTGLNVKRIGSSCQVITLACMAWSRKEHSWQFFGDVTSLDQFPNQVDVTFWSKEVLKNQHKDA